MSSKPHQVAAQLELWVHVFIGVARYLISHFCCSRVLSLDQDISLGVETLLYGRSVVLVFRWCVKRVSLFVSKSGSKRCGVSCTTSYSTVPRGHRKSVRDTRDRRQLSNSFEGPWVSVNTWQGAKRHVSGRGVRHVKLPRGPHHQRQRRQSTYTIFFGNFL